MNNQDSLAKTSKELMLKEPFYGLLLLSLNKEWSKRVPTAGVSKNAINFQLTINEDFWNSLSENHKRGLLKHELLHIGFFHLQCQDEFPNKKLANIAMDIEINQYIDEDDLPEGGCTLESFAQYNLPPKAGCREYYRLLQEAADKEKQQGDGGKSKLEKILDAMSQGLSHDEDGDPVPDHSTWEEFENMSEAEKKLLQSQSEYILKEIAEAVEKSRGTIPGEFQGIIERLRTIEPPKFDWRSYVRRFAGGSNEVFTKKLRRKDNKRFEENPGLKIKNKRHLLVAIDTSGSVSDKEVKEFLNEIHHIHKTGSEVTILQCDTTIRSIEKFKPNQDITLHGRGGTDFDPVLEYYNENTRKYTCMFYLTDGECDTNVKPKGKMLWVISTRGEINKGLPGPQIKLN
jgi:predicted metal-dependent peptidase